MCKLKTCLIAKPPFTFVKTPKHVRTNGIGGEVRHGVTPGVSCETSLTNALRVEKYPDENCISDLTRGDVTPHLHREDNMTNVDTLCVHI